MDHPSFVVWADLSDDELRRQGRSLRTAARRTTVDIVAHLAEVERRELHLTDGYGSLFEYARTALGLAEEEAYSRSTAGHCAVRYPVILELMASGALHLTSVRLLARYLSPENHLRVLSEACGKTRREVEVLIAALQPRPDVPTQVRRVAAPPQVVLATPSTNAAPEPVPASGRESTAGATPTPPRPTAVTPLAPERYRFQTTIGGATLEKLRLAQDLLSHSVARGDDDAVLERALDALLARLLREKFAITNRAASRERATGEHSRHVPARVKRAVYLRDLGRCAHVGTNERRCEQRGLLQFHHLKPWMAGGETTVENVELRCRAHNLHEARRFYDRGDDVGAVAVNPDRVSTRAAASPRGSSHPHGEGRPSPYPPRP
jgi:5-methylcytosine-specific restriction endonuclease McrA